ncbi:MAG: phosphodiester glycosidase family protein [Oscillatoria sp. PMC 1068.18]|nr:phosphodiester glycosidase family protein [Oscillatoria sp. PMC 1076.18]MEC4987770.1 phosphodiester glycosidase family protein [Oscillatoria sp. PMC 1068.18]
MTAKLRRIKLTVISLLILLFAGIFSLRSWSSSQTENFVNVEIEMQFRELDLPESLIYVLLIPVASQYEVTPVVSSKGDTVRNLANQENAIAAINGGFFDPNNQKTTSYMIRDGEIVANPQENERLINNPHLAAYLPRILNRSEWRHYQCGEIRHYTIALRQEIVPPECQLINALGAGPSLLPKLNLEEEAFSDPVNKRDALGSNQRNARSAIGITVKGDLLLVMAAQKPNLSEPSGVTLPELANLMQSLGAEKALNLDGGSSATIYYQGNTYYGKISAEGKKVEREVKSILIVR